MNIKGELRILGTNPFFILSGLVIIFSLISVYAGEILNLSCIGFEVLFPFFSAVTVGEWGKSRADDNYEIIASQGKSIFIWVLSRFITIFTITSLFTLVSMVIVCFIRLEMPLWELVVTWFAPAFFLSTLTALTNLCFSIEHTSTLISGVVWLSTILVRSLLRIQGLEYIYLFIRYAGDKNGIWLINKLILSVISFLIWIMIYVVCKKEGIKEI